MSNEMEKSRRKLTGKAGTFAAIEYHSGVKGRARFYDFRQLYAVWPASGMPERFSRPTKVVAGEVNHKDNFYD